MSSNAELHDRFRDLAAEGLAPRLPHLDAETLRIVAAAVEGVAEAGGEQWRTAPGSIDRDQVLDLLASFIDAGLRAVGATGAPDHE